MLYAQYNIHMFISADVNSPGVAIVLISVTKIRPIPPSFRVARNQG
jgi:hypothetical protein